MKKAQSALYMLLAFNMVFSLFACSAASRSGSDTSSPAASGTSASASAAVSAPVSASAGAAAVSAPAVRKPSTITVGVADWPSRVPDAMPPVLNSHAGDAVYDLLFLIDPNTRQPFSRILSDWKYTDELTFVMTLKPGIAFTNGDKATADDLLFSIRQHFERQDTDGAGVEPIDIDESSSDGKLTVTLKYSKPYGPGIYGTQLYLFDKAWCKKVGWDSEDWYRNPNGTGPYKVTEYVPGDHMKLTLKDNYWNAANEKFDVQNWIIKYYPDASAMYMALEKGDISVCAVENISDYQRWKFQGAKNVGMKICTMGDNMNFMASPTCNTSFEDKNVRQALALGVDWASIGKLVMGELYVPATSSLVKECPYYKNVGAYPYDAGMAKKILKDAGYKDGELRIRVYDIETEPRMNMNEAFQFYCQQLGIRVTLEFDDVTSARFVWMEYGGSDIGWFANAFGDLTCEPHSSWGGLYIRGFTWQLSNDRALVEKCKAALNTVDQQRRRQLYGELQQYMHDNFLIWPVYEDVTAVGYRKDVFTEDAMKNYIYAGTYFALHGLGLAAK